MNEKELKTSPKQRIVISVIAIVMLGSIIASYAAIILGGNKADANSGNQQISAEKMAEYEADYNAKLAEFKKSTQGDFDKFIKYKSEIKAYNESAANGGPVTTKDLVVGDGKELVSGDSDYYAYYVGWCADESIFDSSFLLFSKF